MTMPNGGRSTKKAEVTRSRILDAAAKAFRNEGYVGARLATIASIAHMQAGSLYYHFDSREHLVEEVLRVGQQRTVDFVLAKLASLPPGATDIERLDEAVAAHLISVLEIGDYASATIRIIDQVPEDIRTRQIAAQREYGQTWRDLFYGAQAAGSIRSDVDPSAALMFILGALNSTPDWYHPRPDGLSVEQVADQFSMVFLDGLATDLGNRNRAPLRAVELAARPRVASVAGQPRRVATRARILTAAARVFREKGYARTRLTDVATAANMQAGSLYYHFDSREELVVELLRTAWEHTDSLVKRSVDSLPADCSAIDKLCAAAQAHLLSTLNRGTYTSALIRIMVQVPEELREFSVQHERAYVEYWRRLLQQAVAAGEIRADVDVSAAVMILLGALNWAVAWHSPQGALTPEQLADQFVAMVTEGLASAPHPRSAKRATQAPATR